MTDAQIPAQTPAPAPKANSKTWVVIVVVLVVLAAIAFACKRAASRVAWFAAGGKGKVEFNNGEMKVKTKDGAVEWGTNKLPDGWPSDITIYNGATVQFSGSSNPTNSGGGMAVVLVTSDDPGKVFDFYKKDLVDKGWTLEGVYQAGNAATMAGKKDDRVASVTVSASDGKTTISLGLSKK